MSVLNIIDDDANTDVNELVISSSESYNEFQAIYERITETGLVSKEIVLDIESRLTKGSLLNKISINHYTEVETPVGCSDLLTTLAMVKPEVLIESDYSDVYTAIVRTKKQLSGLVIFINKFKDNLQNGSLDYLTNVDLNSGYDKHDEYVYMPDGDLKEYIYNNRNINSRLHSSNVNYDVVSKLSVSTLLNVLFTPGTDIQKLHGLQYVDITMSDIVKYTLDGNAISMLNKLIDTASNILNELDYSDNYDGHNKYSFKQAKKILAVTDPLVRDKAGVDFINILTLAKPTV